VVEVVELDDELVDDAVGVVVEGTVVAAPGLPGTVVVVKRA
jgi:hypothetical protein